MPAESLYCGAVLVGPSPSRDRLDGLPVMPGPRRWNTPGTGATGSGQPPTSRDASVTCDRMNSTSPSELVLTMSIPGSDCQSARTGASVGKRSLDNAVKVGSSSCHEM